MTLETAASSRAIAERASRGRSLASRVTGVMKRSIGDYSRSLPSSCPPQLAHRNLGANLDSTARSGIDDAQKLERAAVHLDETSRQRQRQMQSRSLAADAKAVEQMPALVFPILGVERTIVLELQHEGARGGHLVDVHRHDALLRGVERVIEQVRGHL